MADNPSSGPTGGNSSWSPIRIVILIIVLGFLFFVLASRFSLQEYFNRPPEPNASPNPNPPALNP